MNLNKNPSPRIVFGLLLVLVVAVSVAYYQYSTQQIPQKVAQSQETIMNVDSLRFTFKVSLMAQKGLSSYLSAIEEQNKDKFYDAVDYFDAAIAFTDIAYTATAEFGRQARQLLHTLPVLLNQYQLSPSDIEVQALMAKVNQVSLMAEQVERQTWQTIQTDYIEFKTNEYRLVQLYEALTISVVLFLSISLALLLRQQRLIRLNRNQAVKLQQMAYFDSLTEIANRKSIEAELVTRIKRSQRTGKSFYVALIDVDDFKNVNDLLGHSAGDELLKISAQYLQKVIRQEDLIGRLGGDEFLIIFDDSMDEQQLLNVLKRIQTEFNRPSIVGGTEFKVTISIGLANYPNDTRFAPDHPEQTLIKSADIAMYQSKRLGKDQYHFYNVDLEAKLQREHALDKEIKQALERNEFEVYLQPQFHSGTQKLIGAEALVRWNKSSGRVSEPAEFIDMIEKGYHTVQFGEWMIQSVIRLQKRWKQSGVTLPMSINLSVKYITSPNFFQRITHLVQGLEGDLSLLVFEITEYELIKSEHANGIEALKALQQKGFRFALDDFGTGYSSISYLTELPIEAIKIDKSFIDFISPVQDKQALVDAIIHIGLILDKTVVAEGVETPYQVEYLQQAGCQVLQGFLFSKPISVPMFEKHYLASSF